MSGYEDDAILIDDAVLTIGSYRWPGDAKRIDLASIRSFEVFQMGFFTGRHRLVGMGIGRPRNWFHWGRGRGDRRTAISLDVGGLVYPTIVPEDPAAVEEILRAAVDTE